MITWTIVYRRELNPLCWELKRDGVHIGVYVSEAEARKTYLDLSVPCDNLRVIKNGAPHD
jgi:hypothetical protein